MVVAELGFDGKALSAFAKKVPKAMPSADPQTNQQRMLERSCLTRIVDQLMKDSSNITLVHSFLLTYDPASAKKPATEWSGQYKTLGQIPTGWLSEYIMHRATVDNAHGITEDFLSKVDFADSENISTIFSCILQLPLSLAFPSDLLEDPFVARATFDARCDEVGERLAAMRMNGAFTIAGALDMKKGGPYSLEFNEAGKCIKVKHATGAEIPVDPETAAITRDFALVDNILDAKALITYKSRKDTLHEMFAEAGGEFLSTMWKPGKKSTILRDHATIQLNKIRAMDAQRAAAGVVNTEVQKPAQQKRALESTAKARASLQQAAEKRQKKRVLHLGD